jgi:hypothetical protein
VIPESAIHVSPEPAAAISEPALPPPEFNTPPWNDGQHLGQDEDQSINSNGQDGNGRAADGGFRAHDAYSSGEQPRGAPTTRYVYKDARGLLYMRVTRTNAKSFPTHRWEDGRWVSGWPATVIPYRLPELLAAPANEPIWITEGEKDADSVAALGLICTTNPGGAGKWQPELAQWFTGKQLIYLLEDNDDAGRAHAAKVSAALNGIVPTIVTVSFPELPEKGDVSDWLEAGGNRKLLIARAAEARKRSSTQRAYIITNLSSVKQRVIDWLWLGHLARGKLELLAASRKSASRRSNVNTLPASLPAALGRTAPPASRLAASLC